MGAITGTLGQNSELAGSQKIISVTAPIASASDTITLTSASHGGFASIAGIVSCRIRGGLDASFAGVQATFSGLVITVISVEGDGTVSTEWSGTTVELFILVNL